MKSILLLTAALLIASPATGAPPSHPAKRHATHPPRTDAAAAKKSEAKEPLKA